MARVQLRGFTKRFGENVVAVDNLNLDVRDKEFVVFLGPSGCGKTTTLRSIAGLEDVTDGEIWIGDRVVNDLDPKQRNIAMVFQSYALYPHMTVYQNMAFPLENAKMAESEIRNRVRTTAKMLEIDRLLDRKPVQLSGGQRQRVALGRALVREPTVFLMDEPLSNLDAKLRVHMRAELKRLQKDVGITTIYVTHDQLEAMTMADRIALLERGKLQQYAPPREMYDRPANQFVAGFIGSPPINQIECELADDSVLDAKDFRIPIPSPYLDAVRSADTREFILAIRPQDVGASREPVSDAIQAPVYTTEPLGDSTIVSFEIGEQIVKAVVSPDFDAAEREQLWVTFPASKVHLFNRHTGLTLA